jgi:hypothetical protein
MTEGLNSDAIAHTYRPVNSDDVIEQVSKEVPPDNLHDNLPREESSFPIVQIPAESPHEDLAEKTARTVSAQESLQSKTFLL